MFCKRVSVFSPQAAGSAQLRVPTTRQAYTWWDPKYWSVARPTDFCYGDCVWGLDNQPVPLSIIDGAHSTSLSAIRTLPWPKRPSMVPAYGLSGRLLPVTLLPPPPKT